MKAWTSLAAALLLFGAPRVARGEGFDEILGKAREDLRLGDMQRRHEAIDRSCGKIVAEERLRFALLDSAEVFAAAERQQGLLALAVDFRLSFTQAQIRAMKEANLERKRLYAAGVRREAAGGLLRHWEGRIADVVRPRYRAFAPARKTFDCPSGARPHLDYPGYERPSTETSEQFVPLPQRNALLPPAGSCWSQAGEAPVSSVRSIGWFFGEPQVGSTTVYAAACAGPIGAWRNHDEGGWDTFFVRPTCVVLDLLDGSLPSGPAPRKYMDGPEIEALRSAGLPGWRMSFVPDERTYVRDRLKKAGVPECIVIY